MQNQALGSNSLGAETAILEHGFGAGNRSPKQERPLMDQSQNSRRRDFKSV